MEYSWLIIFKERKEKNEKEINFILVVFTLLFSLAACSDKITVQFDTDGGSVVSDIEVKVGEKLVLPKDPVKEGYVLKDGY